MKDYLKLFRNITDYNKFTNKPKLSHIINDVHLEENKSIDVETYFLNNNIPSSYRTGYLIGNKGGKIFYDVATEKEWNNVVLYGLLKNWSGDYDDYVALPIQGSYKPYMHKATDAQINWIRENGDYFSIKVPTSTGEKEFYVKLKVS